MKKVFSALFTLIVILVIAFLIYTHQSFAKTQINKVRGIYYVYKGDKAYKEHDTFKAIKLYNEALKLFPGHYGAWYNLGNIYVEYEDYYSALNAYSQAFKYNPRMMIARMNYGVVATQKLGDFDSAIDQFNKIIKTKRRLLSIPYVFNNRVSYKANKAIAYYNMGVAYRLKSLYTNDDWELQRKYLSKAIENYKKSLKINPNSYDTLYNLGVAYHVSGMDNEAGKYYCKAVKTAPLNYEAHYNLAVLLRKMRHFQESYKEIDKAATLITALDQNSAAQLYVAIVMNDITRCLYSDRDYKTYLKDITNAEKEKSRKHLGFNKIFMWETKKDKKNGTISSDEINTIDGVTSGTKDLNDSILKEFGSCPSGLFEF